MSPSSSARNVFLASSSSGSSISTGMLATTGNHSAFLSAVRLGKKVAALQWILGIQLSSRSDDCVVQVGETGSVKNFG